jgi:hypothetical protein
MPTLTPAAPMMVALGLGLALVGALRSAWSP